jgi:hypothetical protein
VPRATAVESFAEVADDGAPAAAAVRWIFAEAMVASPNTWPQPENGRFEVRMIDDFSYRR